MAEGKIVAHIGCSKCEMPYFVLRALQVGNGCAYENQPIERLEGVSEQQDVLTCKECQQPLVRVSAPKPAAVG